MNLTETAVRRAASRMLWKVKRGLRVWDDHQMRWVGTFDKEGARFIPTPVHGTDEASHLGIFLNLCAGYTEEEA